MLKDDLKLSAAKWRALRAITAFVRQEAIIAQARAEGERAGQIAMQEQCARFLDGSADGAAAFAEVSEREEDHDNADMHRAEESTVRGLAEAIRALKVEGE